MPKIIGLDLSLTGTGIAGDGWTETISHPKLRGHARLQAILNDIAKFTIGADMVVVEGPAYGSQAAGRQQGQHERAGLWWLTTHKLWKSDTWIAVAPPNKLKQYATGKGNAGKDDIVREVTRRFDWFGGDNNAADALVLAAMGYDHFGAPIVEVPKTHRAALNGVQWPAELAAAA